MVTWTRLSNSPDNTANAMWLMQDGTMLVCLNDASPLMRLHPDPTGHASRPASPVARRGTGAVRCRKRSRDSPVMATVSSKLPSAHPPRTDS
jgi:hypothetical protein